MKKLTQSQKIYLTVMGVAILAFVWDQCAGGAATPATSAKSLVVPPESATPVAVSETIKADEQNASGTAGMVFNADIKNYANRQPTGSGSQVINTALAGNANLPILSNHQIKTGRMIGLDQRLQIIARQDCLDLSELQNSFEAPRAWIASGLEAAEKPVITPEIADAQRMAQKIQEFKKEHARSIFVGPRAYVFVNGQGIFVGEKYDDFTLVAVEKDRALFELGGSQVTIPLVEDLKIQRNGSVIQNLKNITPSEKPALPSK